MKNSNDAFGNRNHDSPARTVIPPINCFDYLQMGPARCLETMVTKCQSVRGHVSEHCRAL